MLLTKDNNLISPIQVSKEFGISYQTVNYYTNLGFFKIRGNKGNKRLFDRREVKQQLEKIRDLRSKGYPLRLIRDNMVQ